MKRIISMLLVIVMVLSLIPSDIAYGEEIKDGGIKVLSSLTLQESSNIANNEKNNGFNSLATKLKEGYVPLSTNVSTAKGQITNIVYAPDKAKSPTTSSKNGTKVGTTSKQVIVGKEATSEEYISYVKNRILVTEAIYNKNLKSYMTNIALFFSEKGVLPQNTAIAGDLYNDRNKNKIYDAGDLKINSCYSINYNDELSKLEGENLLSSDTSIMDIRDLIALYLYSSDTYTQKNPSGNINWDDVNSYISASPSPTYVFPTNIPVYENGKFITSYNLAKDSHIVNGRNNVLAKFLAAYNESYDLAYYNNTRDEQGLKIAEGRTPIEINQKYKMFLGSRVINGQTFITVNNSFGGILDFELFAMSMNHVRTVIAFQTDTNDFVNFNKISDYATLGRGIFDAPITNLLYTGGVANQTNKDFAEYVGYYKKPYTNANVIKTLTNSSAFRDKPLLFGGLYIEDIVTKSTRDELVQAIKTGIVEIDDKTEARSFNPDVVFGYYNILNGKPISNGDAFNANWFTESDMTNINEGYFYHITGKTKSGKPITRIHTTEKYKEDLRNGKFKQKEDAFLDHFAVTEFPTMFTWGQGMGMRNKSGMWYIDVPLAPVSIVRDIDISVDSTQQMDDGTMQSAVKMRFDNMPYLPENIDSDNIILEVLGKDVEVISISSTSTSEDGYDRSGGHFRYIDFAKEGYDRTIDSDRTTYYDRIWDAEKGKAYYEKYAIVNWKAKPTATKDSKIVFTANLVANDTYGIITSQDTADVTKDRGNLAVNLVPELSVINQVLFAYTGVNVKYSDLAQEATLNNNYAMADVVQTNVDLSVHSYKFNYDESTKKANISILGLLKGRNLVAVNKELPVEVKLTWETYDGQTGTQTKTSNKLFEAGTWEEFIFDLNITPDASGVAPGGTFTVEINPRNVPAELDRTNNIYTGVEFGPKPVNGIDFEIYAPFVTFPIVNDGSSTTTQFKAYVTLNNTTETKNTVVSLYKMDGTKLIADQNVTVVGGNSLIVDFKVNLASLNEGSNNLRLVVNEL